MEMSFRRMHHVAMKVKDVDNSQSFYEHHFGFETYFDHEQVDGVPVVCLRLDDTVLELRVGDVEGTLITTIEGLDSGTDHPIQKAWIEEQVAQCGYCQSGQIMQAAALLADNPKPTDEEIVTAMKFNLCRCMTYPRIKKAIQRASREIRNRNE